MCELFCLTSRYPTRATFSLETFARRGARGGTTIDGWGIALHDAVLVRLGDETRHVVRPTVGKWRRRFLKDRVEGLLDEARPGRPRTIDDDQIAAVIERTLRSTPADATHWSIRSMAGATGFSHTTIRRIWTAFGLQPHRSQTFKLSSDPLFVDKVRDIVGLYLSPPTRALVLSVDEKSQIQALDREQPVLPMMPGIPERRTPAYVRHGTTSLFAALDVASGFVIGKCYRRHRATEFLDFLKQIDARLPEALDVHIIMDNYVCHS
jgi:transposase